jgi:hypothetical protein
VMPPAKSPYLEAVGRLTEGIRERRTKNRS